MGADYRRDPDYLATCARRMERTLNSKPRKAKTLEYVKTLPKRGPVVVSIADYQQAREVGRAVVAAAVAKSEGAPARKDRLRPRATASHAARKAAMPVLLRAQNRRCASCGGLMFIKGECEPGYHFSLDHVIPLSRGGADAIGNFLAMHDRCNNKKGDRAPNGCERVWLLAVNAQIGAQPVR